MSDKKRDQKLLPLFGLSFFLVVIGSYAAISSPALNQTEVNKSWSKPVVQMAEPVLVDGPESSQFSYDWSKPLAGRYMLKQHISRLSKISSQKSFEPATIDAFIRFDTNIASAKNLATDENKKSELDISLSNAEVFLSNNDRLIGTKISDQVRDMMSKARARSTWTDHGEHLDFKWTSSINKQIEPFLDIVKNAMILMVPKFRHEPLNIHESWHYAAELGGISQTDDLELQGQMKFENTWLGWTVIKGKKLAVIKQKLMIDAKGVWRLESHKPRMYTLKGKGDGMLYMDGKNIYKYEMKFNQRLDPDKEASSAIQNTEFMLSYHGR